MKTGRYVMSMDAYQADPCPEPSVSRGVLRDLIYRTPAHVKESHPRLNLKWKDKTSTAMRLGKLGHSLFLEGLDCCAVINPADYPAKNGNIPDGWTNPSIRGARDAAIEAGKCPMLPDEANGAMMMVEAANKQLAASELEIKNLREEGESEVTYIWQEQDIWCRARLDWIKADKTIILDPKFTSKTASPWMFDKQIESLGLDIQAAFYSRAVEAVDGVKPKRFVFFVVEAYSPYLACPISLDPQYVQMGEEKIKMAMGLWRKLLADNDWPGYGKKIYYLEPKPWAIASWEERRFGMDIENQEEI